MAFQKMKSSQQWAVFITDTVYLWDLATALSVHIHFLSWLEPHLIDISERLHVYHRAEQKPIQLECV